AAALELVGAATASDSVVEGGADDSVVAAAGSIGDGQRVLAQVHKIITGAVRNGVVAGASVDRVVASASVDRVIAAQAVNDVIAIVAVARVIAVAADDEIIAGATVDGHIAVRDQGVIPIAAVDRDRESCVVGHINVIVAGAGTDSDGNPQAGPDRHVVV